MPSGDRENPPQIVVEVALRKISPLYHHWRREISRVAKLSVRAEISPPFAPRERRDISLSLSVMGKVYPVFPPKSSICL